MLYVSISPILVMICFLFIIYFRHDASKEFLSNSSPAPEVNTNILADLEIKRGSMTSEGTGTEDQYKDMEDRQPNVNQNGVDRSDSLSSDNSGGLSPGTFTSFHGLNIIAESMSRDGEGKEALLLLSVHLSLIIIINMPFHDFEHYRLLISINGRLGHFWNRMSLYFINSVFSDHNNDLLTLKQWKGVLSWVIVCLRNNDGSSYKNAT